MGNMDRLINAREEVPLGLESAWPASEQLAVIFGAPALVPGLFFSSSSSRDPQAGAAISLPLPLIA